MILTVDVYSIALTPNADDISIPCTLGLVRQLSTLFKVHIIDWFYHSLKLLNLITDPDTFTVGRRLLLHFQQPTLQLRVTGSFLATIMSLGCSRIRGNFSPATAL